MCASVCLILIVHYYRVVIIYYNKVSHSRKRKKGKISDVQGFDWLSRQVIYYLCMDRTSVAI